MPAATCVMMGPVDALTEPQAAPVGPGEGWAGGVARFLLRNRSLLERVGELRTRLFRMALAVLVAEVRGLLSAGPWSAAGAASPPAPLAGSSPLVDPLSRTEVRVLSYLPTNLSVPEIAHELSVSVTTVRTHIRHLFRKLGVHGRTEAVARARALGLLAPPPGTP